MTLGELLKQRRMELDLNQAALAERMGIEQSYLSKLEGDRSIPSEEVYENWLASLNTDTDTLLRSIPRSAISGKMKKVSAIRSWLAQQSLHNSQSQFRWVIISIFMVALAVPLFYTGYSKSLFSETFYQYHSEGVVLPGENAEIFSNWGHTLDQPRNHEERAAKQTEMARRTDPHTQILSTHQGRLFNEPVLGSEGASRTYYINGTLERPRIENTAMQGIGLFLFSFGLLCLFSSKRLSRGNENIS